MNSSLANQTREPEGSILCLGRTSLLHAGCAVINTVGVADRIVYTESLVEPVRPKEKVIRSVARRSKKSRLPLGIVVAIVLILAAFVGSRFLITTTLQSFRTAAPLDVTTYLENANSLRGNVYKIQGEVLNSLGWSPTKGRLIAVGVDGDKQVIPVLVTTSFSHINIQRGQRFVFLLEVGDKGIVRTKDMTKS